ncbi:MAG: type II CAAX endopeptidase family protein [bacterium]
MVDEIDMIPLLCRIAVGCIVFMGATMGIYSMLTRQFLRQDLHLPALDALRNRPLSPLCVIPIMGVTILFAVMALGSAKTSQATPSASSMLMGAGLYSAMLFSTVWVCLSASKIGFRQAFGVSECPWRVAGSKGVRYGFEILPFVLLVSIGVSCIGESLGFDMKSQQIFDCLEDPSVSGWVRAALLFCAVGIAPVLEEFLFRGVLFSIALKGRTFLFAALLTSLYFALMHLHAPSLLPLLVLSVGFSAGYASTGSILTPIVMHAMFNLTGLLLFFAKIR